MEEPQRSQILDSYKVLNAQFDQSVERARADLQAGRPLEDLLVGGAAEFATGSSIEALAAVVVCRLLKEARKPVPKPRRKTNVVANRRTVKSLTREVPDAA
jgi:hypothetical protein